MSDTTQRIQRVRTLAQCLDGHYGNTRVLDAESKLAAIAPALADDCEALQRENEQLAENSVRHMQANTRINDQLSRVRGAVLPPGIDSLLVTDDETIAKVVALLKLSAQGMGYKTVARPRRCRCL